MPRVPRFDASQLRAICMAIGEGITGSEIGDLLVQARIRDPEPRQTKWKRIFNAFAKRQAETGDGTPIATFIEDVMKPVRFRGRQHELDSLRTELNTILLLSGYEVHEDGKIRVVKEARTLREAESRARTLRAKLQNRDIHPDVLRFCRAELLEDNYFHAVLEATKGIADKVREKSGLTSDGSSLVNEAFGRLKDGSDPLLAFNSLRTPSELSEHNGLANLIRGMFGVFRNVTAHEPRIKWQMDEQDALDLLSLASLIQRRLDGAVRT